MNSQSHTSSTNALSHDSLRIDATKLSLKLKPPNSKQTVSKSSRHPYNKSLPLNQHKHKHIQRPKSASGLCAISTFSTRRNDVYGSFGARKKQKLKQRQRPKTANPYSKSKRELLNESLHRLYPTRDELIPPKYTPDEIQRALRLHAQYQKTLQKRSRFINKMNKPKFRSLSKNSSCYYSKLKSSQEMLLYESPYHSMNVDCFDHRELKKPSIPWDLRMYDKPKPVEHMTTKSQMITINATESYKKINSMINNMYRPSIKKFFGKGYDLKTGLDPKYIYQKQHHKRPIYV